MSLTYGFKTPQDILDKVHRDADLLDDEVTSDRLFNFVVTAYSLIDWISESRLASCSQKDAAQSFRESQPLKICGDIANASKHFVLKRRKPITSSAVSIQGWGCGRYGKGGWGVGEEQIEIVLNDGTRISGQQFVQDVLSVWAAFFAEHPI